MTTQYPLGTSDLELDRLAFQHEVWGPTTRAFLERIGVRPGMRVLDLGCGPGFVSFDLSGQVGARGSVVALDESQRWIDVVEREVARRSLANVRPIRSKIEELELEPASFDFVFARWVFSFLSDPDAVAARLARLLVPGGVMAIEDYNHEGISIYPESEGFKAAIRATRATYARMGGSAFVSGGMARMFAAAGLEMFDLKPNVMCGGPDSPAFRWADRFFPHFSGVMTERGLMSASEHEQFLREWEERKRDPTALFFSPMIVDAAGRKPG
jgi:ubiquinone/menaquinone biosynthesis C-methylase UbiE